MESGIRQEFLLMKSVLGDRVSGTGSPRLSDLDEASLAPVLGVDGQGVSRRQRKARVGAEPMIVSADNSKPRGMKEALWLILTVLGW
jgi:hypothetical protein